MCLRSGRATYKNVLSQIDRQWSGTDESLHTFSIGKQLETKSSHSPGNLSGDMRFPTMWYVRPAKPQISLRIRAV